MGVTVTLTRRVDVDDPITWDGWYAQLEEQATAMREAVAVVAGPEPVGTIASVVITGRDGIVLAGDVPHAIEMRWPCDPLPPGILTSEPAGARRG